MSKPRKNLSKIETSGSLNMKKSQEMPLQPCSFPPMPRHPLEHSSEVQAAVIDMGMDPAEIVPIDAEWVARIQNLVDDVKVDLNARLSDDND